MLYSLSSPVVVFMKPRVEDVMIEKIRDVRASFFRRFEGDFFRRPEGGDGRERGEIASIQSPWSSSSWSFVFINHSLGTPDFGRVRERDFMIDATDGFIRGISEGEYPRDDRG